METRERYLEGQAIQEAREEGRKAGIKAVGELLDSQKQFISYHCFRFELHDSELEALKQGKIPIPKRG